jgi:hypothetical protein
MTRAAEDGGPSVYLYAPHPAGITEVYRPTGDGE